MPQDPAAALSSLLRGASIEDHDEVLKAANLAIKSNKNDLSAQHTKVVALLKLDRFDDAVRFIAESGSALESQCALEKAYALYKAGQLEEATATIQAAGLRERSFQHMAAQVAYRAERFDESADIYEKLLASEAAGEGNDLRINSQAVHAQSEWAGMYAPAQPLVQLPDSFELCYNAACLYISKGNFDLATKMLQRAATLCKASDDLGDEEKEAELRPIWIQQAYVYAKQGNLKNAMDLYNSLGTTDDDDPDFAIVAKNNISVTDTKTQNPYLQQRREESTVAAAADVKLFAYQSRRLEHNSYMTDLSIHKAEGVQARTHKTLLKALQPTTSSNTNTVSVVNAVAATQGLETSAAVRELSSLSAKRPLDVGLVLAIIQLQLQQNHAGAALSLLQSFFERLDKADNDAAKDVRFCPGLIALAVSLMRSQGRQTSAKAEFVKAAKHWTSRPAGSSAAALREAGVELMRSSNPDDLKLAGSAFDRLLSENKGSHVAAAGLVAALAAFDPNKAREHVTQLPAVDGLIQDIDVAGLLQSGVVSAPSNVTAKKRPATDDNADKATSKRRRRRLPKNYVEGKTPDPERWLPLRDRSSYRPKNKKGKKKAAESTQGGVVKEEETLGLVGGGGVKVEKANNGGSSKKKKKGKK